MARSEGPSPPRRWLNGFGALDWRTDERAYATLLDALTRDRLEAEALERELSAPPLSDTPSDLQQARDKAERDELADARRELDAFRLAMTDVRQRAGSDELAEVAYDSSNPAQNAAADVLIQYLVRPGYAEVRTEEPQPERYVYYVRVDWPRLRALAQVQGNPISL
ncbi:MAG TPA: hypothetical protein VF937_05130 [Chloroflexota bacterium]